MLKLFRRSKEILKSRKGITHIIAIAIVIIFVLFKVSPEIGAVGDTSKQGIEKLNQDLRQELNLGN